MDPNIIIKLNTLWERIYPYLSRFVTDTYRKQGGDVLELGPFAGGIAQGILSSATEFRIVIADTSPGIFDDLRKEINETPLAQRMIITSSPFSPLVFSDQSFDLVIFRGAFFFLNPAILQEIHRVLRPGGCAIVGGGYGPITPQTLIDEIAEESKQLNQLLGKPWMRQEDLRKIIQEASLQAYAEVSTEGGLWVILRKGGDKEKTPSLADTLSLESHEVIALTGGGGKTTLMFALAEELRDKGLRVITTTTTKIFEPTPDQTPFLIIEADEGRAMTSIKEGLLHNGHVTFAAQRFPEGKIGGVDPQLIDKMARELSVDHIIVEADGAKRLPIKAPGDQEPVIPTATTLLIPIVGIDALGKPLNGEQAFRPERIAELTETQLGAPITPQLIATIMIHPQGLMKGTPSGARIIPFINKVETKEDLAGAQEVGGEILKKEQRIERVVLSKLFFRHPVVEVVERRS
ncbi:MAG: putative selenium-dependent hydroxylase accessory protein YqeC [Deltaproteobacteria bacterium]|nr:putative selenium-dependent hydroxylase accessory protein YqeC [Deltaproteobacteria bacterium]